MRATDGKDKLGGKPSLSSPFSYTSNPPKILTNERKLGGHWSMLTFGSIRFPVAEWSAP